MYDTQGKILTHPLLKSSNVDVEKSNITAALYLSKEDDDRAKTHFRQILSRRANMEYKKYEEAKARCDQYQGEIVIID